MARVPSYDQLQEREQGFSPARVETVASPSLLDAGAEQTEKLGKSEEAAGTGLAQIQHHMAQRENHDVVFTNEAADKAAYLSYEADLRQNRQGNTAKGATTDTATWWKDRITKNVEGMNSEQKRIYTQRITDVQMQAIHSVGTFEAQQLEVAHDQSWNADKINTINLASATPTEGIVATAVGEIKNMNSYQGVRKGWDAKVLQAENGKDITNLHAQAIQTLAKDNPNLAAAYFKAHEMEIDGSKRAEIGLFAQKATAARVGADTAAAEWALNGPKGDNDASNIDTMKKAIRDKLKDEPFARDAALQEISQIDADRDKAIKARDSNRTASVNTMLMGGATIASVQQTPAWAALDGTEQRKIVEHEAEQASLKEGRKLQQLTRQQAEKHIANLDIAMKLSDPDQLVALTRPQIINLRTTIGDESTQRLLDKWDAYTKNGTVLSEAKLDNDQFNAFATRAGLDPNSKDDAMKKRIVDTRDKVERIIGSEQQARKKSLTRDEKDKILQQQIDNAVIQHNVIMRDQSIPAITLPDDKQASAYVVVGGNEVRLSSIPVDYRSEITAARRARGLPTNEQTIAELWTRKQDAIKAARKKMVPTPDDPSAVLPEAGN